MESHLLQMRGLKQITVRKNTSVVKSHLLQMRGLKHRCTQSISPVLIVASFTDAWIETL